MSDVEASRYKYRGRFSANFPLSRFESGDVEMRKFVLEQSVRKHDLLTLSVRSKSLDWYRTLASGAPVQVDWSGMTSGNGRFVGYVSHVKPYVRAAKNRFDFDIICIAASWDMRKTGKTTWRNKSVPEIAQAIGKEFGYKVITKSHPLRRSQTVLAGESYWEFLHRMGERIGYSLRVDQTTLYFLPVEAFVKNEVSRAPYLTTKEMDPTGDWDSATISSFTAWGGDTNEDPEYSPDTVSVTAIDPQTGTVHTVKKDPQSALKKQRKVRPRYTRYAGTVAAHSRKDAELLAQGRANNGAMSLDGHLCCIGDATIQPYKPVFLALTEPDLSGYWIVKSVTHTINGQDGEYTVDAVVSTDSLDPGGLPVRRGKKVRDLEAEAAAGWTPSKKWTSSLRVSNQGFVRGMTANGQNAARWVAV